MIRNWPLVSIAIHENLSASLIVEYLQIISYPDIKRKTNSACTAPNVIIFWS